MRVPPGFDVLCRSMITDISRYYISVNSYTSNTSATVPWTLLLLQGLMKPRRIVLRERISSVLMEKKGGFALEMYILLVR